MATLRPTVTLPGLNGGAPRALVGTGNRVNATAGSSSTSEATVPTNAAGGFVRVVTSLPAAIRFGATGVGAAAADADSTHLPAGEFFFELAATDTHFRVIRLTGTDALMQLETVSAK